MPVLIAIDIDPDHGDTEVSDAVLGDHPHDVAQARDEQRQALVYNQEMLQVSPLDPAATVALQTANQVTSWPEPDQWRHCNQFNHHRWPWASDHYYDGNEYSDGNEPLSVSATNDDDPAPEGVSGDVFRGVLPSLRGRLSAGHEDCYD